MAMVINAPPKIWPENMMETIEVIVKLLSRCPELLLFKFEMNREAAESNFHVLRKFNFDLEEALVARRLVHRWDTGWNSVKENFSSPSSRTIPFGIK